MDQPLVGSSGSDVSPPFLRFPDDPRRQDSEEDLSGGFPPLFVRPSWPTILTLLLLVGGAAAATLHWQGALHRRGVSDDDLLKYASIPIVSVIFTYVHIWAALWMTFYPITFRGCLQVPGTNWGCGWQGIVPSKGEKMARTSVELMTTQLLDVKEVISRIDPAALARELDEQLPGILSRIINEVAVQEEPAVWSKLPAVVKNELIYKARAEAPPVIQAMAKDVQQNIETVFDLKEMVVNSLVREPRLLNYMFISCGGPELAFIRNCGAYMGGVFGIIQVSLYLVWTSGWMLPTFGLVVGMVSNWIALKMIFEPVIPKRFCCGRIVIQGLFLKRQKEVSAQYAKIVSSRVLSARYLVPAVVRGRCSDALFALVHKHVQTACDNYVGPVRLAVRAAAGREKYNRCKSMVGKHIVESFSDTMVHAERYIDGAMDLEGLLREKMEALEPLKFEGLLHPVFQEDEWKLVLMGGVLGAVVGFAQWYVLGS